MLVFGGVSTVLVGGCPSHRKNMLVKMVYNLPPIFGVQKNSCETQQLGGNWDDLHWCLLYDLNDLGSSMAFN